MSSSIHRLNSKRATPSAQFRPYPANSAKAEARLVAIALLVDGEIDDHELARLNDPHWLASNKLDRASLIQALHELCEDLAKLEPAAFAYPLREDSLSALFAEISDPAMRARLTAAIRHVLECDGNIATQEAQLWQQLQRCWTEGALAPAEPVSPRKPDGRNCARN